MKKFITFIFTVFLAVFTCACDNEQSQILFNEHPFNAETITSGTNIFKPGERVYYLITLPNPVQSKRLFIQVVKTGGMQKL